MERKPEFDDIRPYYDEEVAPAIGKLLKNPQFQEIMKYLFPEEKRGQVEKLMQTFTSKYNFQAFFIRGVVWDLLHRTATGVSCKGFENVSKMNARVYISNHRDIVLDPAILNVLLFDNGFETVEIAIGDNLLLADWIKDIVRLNKSFLVKRSASLRQLLEVSQHLSRYIHHTILDKNQSIWIAQREGRAKDSNDRTQESLLKMLAMAGDQSFLKNLAELNLTPVTFSYEYDPCDYLKAKEYQQKRDNPDFNKSQDDDLLNMQTGLLGNKGRIHLQIGRPINPPLLKLNNLAGKNELAFQVADIIDKAIFLNYQFYPINYVAYDRLVENGLFSEKYTLEDVENVERYFQQQLDKIDLPDKDVPFLMKIMLEMYANPVKNFIEASR